MKKRTTAEKKKRVEQITNWINDYSKQLYRLENKRTVIKKEILECEQDIEKYRLIANNHPDGIPQYFNDNLLEQKSFDTIQDANDYIYNTVHPAINKLYYANAFLNTLSKRTYLEIEIMTDHREKINELKSKIVKHQKNLDKLEEMKSYSSKKLLKTLNTKNDYTNLLSNIETKMKSLKATFKTHLLNLNMNRESIKKLKFCNDGIYDDYIKQYSKEDIQKWKNRLISSSRKELIQKRRNWIKATIKKIRVEKEKLKKVTLKYEKYLLESGSEGEKAIRHYLNENNISFEEQKRFKSCKNKVPLPFDFFIKDYKILIEFDGAQHFMPIDLFGGEEGFKQRVSNDTVKTNWAKDNGYNLQRIRYDEFENINTILDKILKKVLNEDKQRSNK